MINSKNKTILITGASSGLGRALAVQYANKGICLILFARSEGRLKEVADICRRRQAEVVEVICDVKDAILTETYMEKFCNNYNNFSRCIRRDSKSSRDNRSSKRNFFYQFKWQFKYYFTCFTSNDQT